ncbi:heparinase II/III family protein [Pontiellaceae bacterium B12227]|nr:heparinase II/III family protein [Pontiellaceae bacterium B12227]
MMRYILLATLSFLLCRASFAEDRSVPGGQLLDSLADKHPRLMLKEDALRNLKQQAVHDETLQEFVRAVILKADGQLEAKPFRYRENKSILGTSRACMHRIYELGIAWRWTGEKKYAQKIEETLLNVCDFPSWYPRHFLDPAEMAHAVGVGYDWIYDEMDEPTRKRIRTALVNNALKPGIDRYRSGYHHFTYGYNWNQVCNGGLLVGALAIAESEPEIAEFILANALRNLPTAMASYAPDGVWAEGLNYWRYATTYTVFALSALETALGSDFDLSEAQGFSMTGYVPIYSTGPPGLYFSYADAGDFQQHGSAPCQFWLARRFKNADFSDAEYAIMQPGDIDPLHVMWYVPRSGKTAAPPELDRLLNGQVETALFRSAWDDPNALFVGIKAGYNQAHHGHLDLGNFELDALGVRWARDLGADSYALKGYWEYREGGRRWNYYRLNSFSHNVPLLGGQNQDANAVAEITRFKAGNEFPFVQIDLSEAYASHASNVMRGVAMVDQRRAVLIQDEFEIQSPCEAVWGMTTDAEITVQEPGRAILRLEGKELIARVLSPAGATFSVESAEQEPPEKRNEGVSRLVVRIPEANGKLTIALLFSPQWGGDSSVSMYEIEPLNEW